MFKPRAHTDIDELFDCLQADEERQREALRKFYERNASGHYTRLPSGFWRKVRNSTWGLFFAGALATFLVWEVLTKTLDVVLGALGR